MTMNNVKVNAQFMEIMEKAIDTKKMEEIVMNTNKKEMTKEEIIAMYKEAHMQSDEAGFEDWNPVSYGSIEKAIIGAWCANSLPKHGKAVEVVIWARPQSWNAPMVDVTYSDGLKQSFNVGIPSDKDVLYAYYRVSGKYAKARAIKKALKMKGECCLPGTVKVIESY